MEPAAETLDTLSAPADTVEDAAPVEDGVPVEDVPLVENPVAEAYAPITEQAATPPVPSTGFVSLYDSAGTSLLAVILGIVIVGGVQWIGARSFHGGGGEHKALTRFVTAMVAVMVGVYVSDMLIAGPNAMLLAESERLAILSFVKDTALMIFAYYFGTKSAGKEPE